MDACSVSCFLVQTASSKQERTAEPVTDKHEATQRQQDAVGTIPDHALDDARGPKRAPAGRRHGDDHHVSAPPGCHGDETFDEVLQHLQFARTRCELFHGRQDTMSAVRQYLTGRSRRPLVVFGPSGCGKTSILAKTVDSLSSWADQAAAAAAAGGAAGATAAAGIGSESRTATDGDVNNSSSPTTRTKSVKRKKIVTVVRFLGTTPMSSNVRDLLSSVCRQLDAVYCAGRQDVDENGRPEEELQRRRAAWHEPDKMSDLVAEFHRLLASARRQRPLLLVLDSIDQLSPVYDAYRVTWLPVRLPPHVKLVVSTLVDGYDVLDNLRTRSAVFTALSFHFSDAAQFIRGPFHYGCGVRKL